MTESVTTAARILIVEDDVAMLHVLERILTAEGYAVSTASDGETALVRALDLQPDLLIIDVGLPVRSGVDVTRELRERQFRAPVLMLTARSTLGDKVTGLDAGADDYLAKPVEIPELVARVKALLRRSSITAAGSVLHVRDLTLDPISRRVRRAGRDIDLTQKEYAVLEYLMRHAGRPVTRQMVAEHVWKHDIDPLTNVVDVYINYLRKKLDDDKADPVIRTLRGTGYVIQP